MIHGVEREHKAGCDGVGLDRVELLFHLTDDQRVEQGRRRGALGDAKKIAAIKNGCYECVNEVTCQPWGEPGCRIDLDCQAGQHCDDCATASCYECDDCVAGCVDEPIGPECYVDADCRPHSDYCGGCYCLPLGIHEEPPTCDPDDFVYCFADPCMNKDAVCARGICHVVDAKPDSSVGRR